ncbi:MAG: VanZ family protein [Acidobacteriota bacterium]|nr:MAG: VanZ family protein [Acidobacteriota bacterium]
MSRAVPAAHEGGAPPASRWRLVVPVGLMIMIAVASHQSSTPSLPGSSDKLAHFTAFGLLAVAWWYAFGIQNLSLRARALLAVTASTLWGVLDEWHQSFVPGRTPSAADVVADGLGALLAAGLAWLRAAR